MDELNFKLSIKAIAAQFDMSIETMANECGIPYNHLKMVSSGYVKMTAEDIEKISIRFDIPMRCIQTDYSK